MARPSPLRPVSLFSPQALAILKPPLQLCGSSATEESGGDVSDLLPSEVVVASNEEPISVVSECLSCHVTFDLREEQVAHYRLDWHRYNLKRKLRGLPHVTQEVFEVEAGDLSSISGSESDSEGSEDSSQQTTPTDSTHSSSSPFVYFTSADSETVYSVYRVILTGGKQYTSTSVLLPSLLSLSQPTLWIVLMQSGGHFAGAVFRGSSVLVHKTFHRYTVRAKRGTSQAARDSQSGGHGPRSAGASLRRYNEVRLEQEVQELLASWSPHVIEADAIFIRTPKTHQSMFTGGQRSPLSKEDPRVRGIPFATKRPTLKEVKCVHSCLASIYVGVKVAMETVPIETVAKATTDLKPVSNNVGEHCKSELVEVGVVRSEDGGEGGDSGMEEGVGRGVGEGKRKKKTKKKKRKADEPRPECDQSVSVVPSPPTECAVPPALSQLLGVCQEGGEVEGLLGTLGLSPLYQQDSTTNHDSLQQPIPGSCPVEISGQTTGQTTGQVNAAPPVTCYDVLNVLYGGVSLLHVASEHGHASVVGVLLHYGADPTIRDTCGRVPYMVAKEKSVRDCYRRFMAQHPLAYDYTAAQIPSPLTEDMERERREKAAEKKREKKRHAKKKQLEEKARREEEEVVRRQVASVAVLTEREKRALAAEGRLALQHTQDSSVQRAGLCNYCGRGLAGLVPFHRLQYHYCSMPCVRDHRTQLEVQNQ